MLCTWLPPVVLGALPAVVWLLTILLIELELVLFFKFPKPTAIDCPVSFALDLFTWKLPNDPPRILLLATLVLDCRMSLKSGTDDFFTNFGSAYAVTLGGLVRVSPLSARANWLRGKSWFFWFKDSRMEAWFEPEFNRNSSV